MSEDIKNGFLDDNSGNRSSKRLFGAIILTVALLLSVFTVIWDVLHTNIDIPAAEKILEILFISGTSLLGFGVIENFAKPKKNE